jgi:hypothetical protein
VPNVNHRKGGGKSSRRATGRLPAWRQKGGLFEGMDQITECICNSGKKEAFGVVFASYSFFSTISIIYTHALSNKLRKRGKKGSLQTGNYFFFVLSFPFPDAIFHYNTEIIKIASLFLKFLITRYYKTGSAVFSPKNASFLRKSEACARRGIITAVFDGILAFPIE